MPLKGTFLLINIISHTKVDYLAIKKSFLSPFCFFKRGLIKIHLQYNIRIAGILSVPSIIISTLNQI